MWGHIVTTPWQLDSQKVKVCEDNDHLGQILSGARQEEKNVDLRIKKRRNNMLGPVGSFKCLLSSRVKTHLFRNYACPILRSGLSSFSEDCSKQILLIFMELLWKGTPLPWKIIKKIPTIFLIFVLWYNRPETHLV